MKNKVIKHEDGFYYIQLENGKIQVSSSEMKKYINNQHITMNGSDYCEINGVSDSFEYDFTKLIKNGTLFWKIDMFGNKHIVSKKELSDFILMYYEPI